MEGKQLDKQLLIKVIERKQKSIKTFTVEQMVLAGLISGFIGLMFGEFYSIVLGSIAWQIANCFIYMIIGVVIGYFTSKNKKEELLVELMLLESLKKTIN